MLFETWDIGLEPRTTHLIAGLLLGLIFGVAAQISRFCLRRAIAGDASERGSAAAVWATGLAAAVVGFLIASSMGLTAVVDHRLASTSLPFAAIILGGLAFGTGMVLTRGCVSRLTVLSGTGNMRSVFVLLVFAVAAHATLKGVLAPVRTTIGSVTTDLPFGTLADVPFGFPAFIAVTLLLTAILIRRSNAKPLHLVLGAVVGLVAVGGWMATSTLLFDEFDPMPIQSAAFTLPWSDSLFWLIASSAIPAGFGVGFIGGTLTGSFLSGAARGELQLQSFTSGHETVRYLSGGALMGVGGVLAGGCTVGAGLSGTAMGSIAALLALASIISSSWITARVTQGTRTAAATA